MKTIMNQIVATLLASLMTFHFACGTAQRPLSQTPGSFLSGDGSSYSLMVPVDVVLEGLPDASREPDASDVSIPLISSPGPLGEAIVPLARGAQAPFNGVLFNGPAVARVSVEFQAQQQRCSVNRQHDVALLTARYNSDMETLRLALSTQQRTDQVLLTGRDLDIARLNQMITAQQRQMNGPHLVEGLAWAGGGMLVGSLLIGGIVFLANGRP